jgi:hypothetical protein
MGSTQGFAKETSGRSSIPALRKHKFERITLGIDGPVKISPNFLDFDVGFIGSPGVVGGF